MMLLTRLYLGMASFGAWAALLLNVPILLSEHVSFARNATVAAGLIIFASSVTYGMWATYARATTLQRALMRSCLGVVAGISVMILAASRSGEYLQSLIALSIGGALALGVTYRWGGALERRAREVPSRQIG